MLTFYWVAFGLMLVAAIYCYKTGRSLFALNGIILMSFISFFALWYSLYGVEIYSLLDTVRVLLIMLVTFHCGLLSNSKKWYYLYVITLLVHLVTNGANIFFSNIESLSDNIYLTISVLEVLLFVVGMLKTIKINNKTRGASYGYNTDSHYIDFNSEYFNWAGRSDTPSQKGERR